MLGFLIAAPLAVCAAALCCALYCVASDLRAGTFPRGLPARSGVAAIVLFVATGYGASTALMVLWFLGRISA